MHNLACMGGMCAMQSSLTRFLCFHFSFFAGEQRQYDHANSWPGPGTDPGRRDDQVGQGAQHRYPRYDWKWAPYLYYYHTKDTLSHNLVCLCNRADCHLFANSGLNVRRYPANNIIIIAVPPAVNNNKTCLVSISRRLRSQASSLLLLVYVR